MNLIMAKTYLSAQDPKMITRTWADVLARFCDRRNANTRMTKKNLTAASADGLNVPAAAACRDRADAADDPDAEDDSGRAENGAVLPPD